MMKHLGQPPGPVSAAGLSRRPHGQLHFEGFVRCFIMKHLTTNLLEQVADVGVAASSGSTLINRGGACGSGSHGPVGGDTGG